eukprot:scaffold52118_cov13-Tisochrysis_lutea.AAC.1
MSAYAGRHGVRLEGRVEPLCICAHLLLQVPVPGLHLLRQLSHEVHELRNAAVLAALQRPGVKSR